MRKYLRIVEFNKEIPFQEIISWLGKKCPELDGGELSINNRGKAKHEKQHLSLGLSQGLRALHDSGKIIVVPLEKDTKYLWKSVTNGREFTVYVVNEGKHFRITKVGL